jgi:phosphatidylglycerophosphate synthase
MLIRNKIFLYSCRVNLHRISGKAEWSTVALSKRNGWQRVAAATHGVVTIGNFFSLIGILSVPFGLWLIIGRDDYLLGVVTLAAGRLGDVIDGWAADKTGTKSPLGELIDATFDKISIAVTVVGLLIAGAVPWWALLVWLLPHLINSMVALLAWRTNRRLHPSAAGKVSTATGWISILGFAASPAFTTAGKHSDMYYVVYGVALALLLITAVLGLMATVSYIREFFGRKV